MRKLGFEIETLALQYLEAEGFQLICRNFQCRQGEIDLIGLMNKALVFVEVRFRKNAHYGSAKESITANKQKKILHTAHYFLRHSQNLQNYSCRFDVIAVTLKMRDYVIEWIPNAFT